MMSISSHLLFGSAIALGGKKRSICQPHYENRKEPIAQHSVTEMAETIAAANATAARTVASGDCIFLFYPRSRCSNMIISLIFHSICSVYFHLFNGNSLLCFSRSYLTFFYCLCLDILCCRCTRRTRIIR